MAKLEQIFILLGLIASIAIYCIASYWIMWLFPNYIQYPLGVLFFSLLGFGVCRIIRKSF